MCAGAKAILDLRATLEVLETHGVPVLGYGTDELPAFYSRRSGLKLPGRLDSAEAFAQALRVQDALGAPQGMVVANPIATEHEIPAEVIGAHIDLALAEAAREGVVGAAVTPFLLARVSELTAGASLLANIELVLSNARLAAAIAAEHARLRRAAAG